ncbi:MAG: sulfite exporter TauE/SafE family protein [Chloroflexi bacterium]|nr:sulfite exporter TauE/SafE family protein [Chloroflexota bacterium]
MDEKILLFILVGFMAQIVDGTLGMAHGVISASFLLGLGVTPAGVSASVHTTKVFTTFASGMSHWGFGNVDQSLVKRLVIPGVVGGVLGALVLSALPGKSLTPFVSFYLLLMGVRILAKALEKPHDVKIPINLFPLGMTGGFLDAIGGGGWGPIVTSTLMANGHTPRLIIGSVNMAEFFVSLAQTLTFILTIRLTHWDAILGLILGGVLAAPPAAYLCKKLPVQPLMAAVGLLIIVISVRTMALAF